jgi:hypothetical protein
MNLKKQILKFFQTTYADILPSDDSDATKASKAHDPRHQVVQEMFDGMSTGTARIIIEKQISQEIREKFKIDQVENQGRYYLARIVRHDGSTIQRLLVDKQTGNIRMVGMA